MRKVFVLIMALGFLIGVTACGVAQEDLDDAVAERDAARSKIERLEVDLEADHELLETLEATDLGAVLLATAKYQDEAVAVADGYVGGGPCVQAPPGGMGIHYVNEGLLEAPPDLLKPVILLYNPTDDGVRLIGVEYIAVALVSTADGPAPWFDSEAEPADGWVSSAPSLLGTTFNGPMAGHGPEDPWHYDLHVWLWENNPSGMFADFNPNVSCP